MKGEFMGATTTNDYEIDAVRDESVLGEGRLHYVFPIKPNKPEIMRALEPIITGGIWITRNTVLPDRIIITLK
jgi:hypothetical protein